MRMYVRLGVLRGGRGLLSHSQSFSSVPSSEMLLRRVFLPAAYFRVPLRVEASMRRIVGTWLFFVSLTFWQNRIYIYIYILHAYSTPWRGICCRWIVRSASCSPLSLPRFFDFACPFCGVILGRGLARPRCFLRFGRIDRRFRLLTFVFFFLGVFFWL